MTQGVNVQKEAKGHPVFKTSGDKSHKTECTKYFVHIITMLLEVVGLRVEHTLLNKCEGNNCDFTYYLDDGINYVFLLIDRNSSVKYELTLYEDEGECASGWTTATFGCSDFKNVCRFLGKTHIPVKRGGKIEFCLKDDGKICVYDGEKPIFAVQNSFFDYSECGEDAYYPAGYINVNMDEFKICNPHRIIDKRPVWIYYGESCSGKSYLSAKYNDLAIYETDMNSELPNDITASIIVLGNKYKFTIEDVKSKIFHLDKCDVILVNFSRKDEIKKLKTKIEHLKYKPSEGYENTKKQFCVKTGRSRRSSC